MKNGDILKCFFDGQDVEKILNAVRGPSCPPKSFQEKHPCGICGEEDGSACKACWRAFLNSDDGLQLSMKFNDCEEKFQSNIQIMKRFFHGGTVGALSSFFSDACLCPYADFKERKGCSGRNSYIECYECWESFFELRDGLTLIPDPEKKENTD